MVALSAEAQPIVASLGLRGSQRAQPFRSYHGDNCHLFVSGVGKLKTAAACGWAGAVVAGLQNQPTAQICWLNAGICGHGSRPKGALIRASSIEDEKGDRRFYPPDIFPTELPADRLVSVDEPQQNYAQDTAYDMEANAFWMTASRFSSSELLSVIKVVSDGPNDAIESLDRSAIVTLAERLVAPIQSTVCALTDLSAELDESPSIQACMTVLLARWHFSVSRERKLRRLLIALSANDELPEPADSVLMKKTSAQDVLDELNDRLMSLPVRLTRHG